jgi:hypothetical protein
MKEIVRAIGCELFPLMGAGLVLSICLILGIGWLRLRPIIALENTFSEHRQEFTSIAAAASETYRKTCKYEFPESPLYKRAYIADEDGVCLDQLESPWSVWKEPTKIWIEFIIDDFYLPIVYIESDDPMDVYDTCSHGGIPTEKLEPNWYICKRDWN